LVLPSPNGSAIAAAAASGTVVAACLRNARAVAAWIAGNRGDRPAAPVTVIAAGERWPDGSLRPALEDLLGAGAVISALVQSGAFAVSPEAAAARALHAATASVPDAVRRGGSGVELHIGGYGRDVDIAVELDASDVVPVLMDGAFRGR
jgi:2-phosphosulfolactate phosphatase